MSTFMRTAAAAWALALLSACGSSHNSTGTSAATSTTKHAPRVQDALSRSLVSAVAETKPGSVPIPVAVQFALQQHPLANEPADLDVVLTPTSAALDRLAGTVQGEPGIEIVSGGELAPADKPAEGAPLRYNLKILSKQDGIYLLTVNLAADSGGVTTTQSYTIPVITGAGIADLPVTGPATGGKAAKAAAPAPTAPTAH
jgi:hypothetical protein